MKRNNLADFNVKCLLSLVQSRRLNRMAKTAAGIVLIFVCGLVAPPNTHGVEITINAEFKPDPAFPNRNVFTNKTPNTGQYCYYNPADCASKGVFGIAAPVVFRSAVPVVANHTDPRQGAMVTIPGAWRTLTVRHNQTLETEEVKIRITGFGTVLSIDPDTVHTLVPGATSWGDGHNKLWSGSNWSIPPSPCTRKSTPLYTGGIFWFFWGAPEADVTCAKKALYNIPKLAYHSLDFAYELKTPDPLGMSAGDYSGNLAYTIGPYQDFDMGDLLIPNSSVLNLNFNLNVQHTLKVDIPPGGNRVELVPKGGWYQWLLIARVPETLASDQSFSVSASSRFKMLLSCERVMGDTCALSNNVSHNVPINIFVSLPGGITDSNGASITRKPLLTSGQGTELFQPSRYVDGKTGVLHFEIEKKYVNEMLDQEGTYKGNVTVIWDSEV